MEIVHYFLELSSEAGTVIIFPTINRIIIVCVIYQIFPNACIGWWTSPMLFAWSATDLFKNFLFLIRQHILQTSPLLFRIRSKILPICLLLSSVLEIITFVACFDVFTPTTDIGVFLPNRLNISISLHFLIVAWLLVYALYIYRILKDTGKIITLVEHKHK
ncbi:uncharacterized protein MONOS_10052 [Monocercomonoides exilis]|uniref:uncharacterized protein n=1 Tax=Monocercomonoides exilis TaxID=2049356 RepID=UPI00355A4403|nr:hypothetical protein MONOS_10052 [Monocercomonoides exilis]|eukprot:MONOS_10052.1-p1 / transcript=MONOS_10052.1 / gene=MONOS_10052 / organism=Monocercomonoides_exilis_PA203 / gene_product=unspecified product / transcript_product=unspecified product / location=Mono_scaffold00440:33155-33833(-) / protein_length=160 / sequence_SO=supercontig / SO=protein_coding / is_pseudo=false